MVVAVQRRTLFDARWVERRTLFDGGGEALEPSLEVALQTLQPPAEQAAPVGVGPVTAGAHLLQTLLPDVTADRR